MSDGRAERRLRALIAEALADWSADHQRGLPALRPHRPAGVADRVFRNLAGYGPLEPLLADPDVWEIMVNGPTDLFVKRHNGTSGYHDEVFHDDDHVVRTLTKILDDASGSHRKLDPAEGLQDAQLPDGARLHIVHGDAEPRRTRDRQHPQVHGRPVHVARPTSSTGAACPSTRRPLPRRAASGPGRRSCSPVAPGSGKTTLLSCCAAELDPSLRVVVAEEVFEVDIALPNVASLQTRPAPPRPPGHRPPPARRRVPADGSRRRHRRRGARPRGAAVAPHALVGGEGVHHASTPARPARR